MDFDLEVPDRIHIMPVGYEEDRIYLAADELKADEVVLLVNKDDSDQDQKHLRVVKDELLDRGYEPRTVPCDIFNLYESLGTIASIIHEFDEEDIFVNVATGSKVTAIAGMIAAMTNEATAYYVKASSYKEDDIPRGVENIIKLPRYPIESPETQHIKILNFLLNHEYDTITKSDLINFSDENNLQFLSGKNITKKGKYRLLDNHIIQPLLRKGYIQVSEEGRNRVISIKKEGKELVEAFGYLIETEENKGISTTLSDY